MREAGANPGWALVLAAVLGCGGGGSGNDLDAGDAGPADPCGGRCNATQMCINDRCVERVADNDGDAFTAEFDCDDEDPNVGSSATRACSAACGAGIESCVTGTWGPCVCQDGGVGDGGTDTGAGDAGDAGPLDGGGDASQPPVVTAVNYAVVAHGAELNITGQRFSGVTVASIGGVDHAVVVTSDSQASISEVSDATPLGAQPLVLSTANASSTPLQVTVIHLVINELDDNSSSGTDLDQYVEITTGVPSVDLSGYALAFIIGSDVTVYHAVSLTTSANTEGRMLIGSDAVVPTPDITWPAGEVILRDSGRTYGVAIYQRVSVATGGAAPASGIIDAMAHDRGAGDTSSLQFLFSSVDAAVSHEDSSGLAAQSHSRCSATRRDGRSFLIIDKSPGADNPCP